MIHNALSEIAKLASATSIIQKYNKPVGISSFEMIKSMDASKIGTFAKEFNKAAIRQSIDTSKFDTSKFISKSLDFSKSVDRFARELDKNVGVKTMDTTKMLRVQPIISQASYPSPIAKIAQSANILNNHSFFNDFVKKIRDHKYRL